MADIELVIKIPEVYYEALKNSDEIVSGQRSGKTLMSVIYNAIANGTPLPKGHGRLGDLDELETYFKNVRKELKPEDYKYAVEYFTRDNMLLNAEQFIHLMDALIPAEQDGDE